MRRTTSAIPLQLQCGRNVQRSINHVSCGHPKKGDLTQRPTSPLCCFLIGWCGKHRPPLTSVSKLLFELVVRAAAWHGVEMDPEQYGINVVPCFIDSSGRTHLLSVEQLQSHSAADLDFLLAHTEQAFPSMEVLAHLLYLKHPAGQPSL